MTEPLVILSGVVGSRAYGTFTVDSDTDVKGIAVPPIENVLGMRGWEGVHGSTAANNTRSGPGDVDTVIYELRKWAHLAAKGNPNILELLWLPEYQVRLNAGQWLIDNRQLFVSKDAGRACLGYMRSQVQALNGMRNKRTNRPELVHKHGYDTKYAYEAIKIGFEGVDLMTNHGIYLPGSPQEIESLMEIRNGKLSKEEFLKYAEYIEDMLKTRIKESPIREHPARDEIDALLIDIQQGVWSDT